MSQDPHAPAAPASPAASAAPSSPAAPARAARRAAVPWWHKALAIVVALVAWQAVSWGLHQKLLLVGPWTALRRVVELAPHGAFWGAIGFSFGRIAAGFLIGFLVAAGLAVASYRWEPVATLIWPFMSAVKATPVASFVILCLIWLSASGLSVVISFLVVLPVVYTNLLEGLRATDPGMLQMARVFRAPWHRRLTYIYLPSLRPSVTSALGIALGMSWKAGIAAEVIGIPDGSIGERLYQAKVYLSSADLFAWTIVIIIVSIVFEKVVLALVRAGYRRLERA
jgi:NitT/TauT family transport system permease protein